MQTIKYKNHTIKVDQDPDPSSPKDWDCLGTIVTQSGYAGDKLSPDKIREILEDKSIIWLPIYTYEHSGVWIKTTPFDCQWDSWQDGIIYVTKANAEKEYGTNYDIEKVKACLKAEVESWNQYLSGEVYWYDIEDAQGNSVDSCCGFYGDVDYCIKQAQEYVDSIVPQSIKLLKKLQTSSEM